tara:strand:+ start:7392 stop:8264 length:873 start_codon:yes stop_codon:yes gene_type:complete
VPQEAVPTRDSAIADDDFDAASIAAAKRSEKVSTYTIRVGSLLAGLAVWALIAATEVFHPAIFPPPWDVGGTLVRMILDGSLIGHIAVSLSRVFIGFMLATAIAIPLGIAMGLSTRCFMIIEPLVEFLRPVPPLALVPLAVVWFGIGWTSKVFLIAYGCFFAIVVNTVAGMKAVDPVHVRAARALGASRWQILIHVILRSAVPDIVVGLRLAVGLAFLLIVGSELIAASEGLGWLIWDARYHFQGDTIVVGMIAIGVVGLLLNRLLLVMERYLLRWRSAEEGEGRVAGLG